MPPSDAMTLTPGNRVDELAAMMALVRSKAISADDVSELVSLLGSAVRLVQRRLEDVLFTVEDATSRIAGAVTSTELAESRGWAREWFAAGYDARTVLDANYPANLLSAFNRPPILFVKGVWRETEYQRSISIVGARKASPEGRARAARLARELVEDGYTIVSGLAEGIDAAAHAAALDAGGYTVAVLGTGVDRVYPAKNRPLVERIIVNGSAVISQFAPDQPPTRWSFPRRNITMSALALATVVVEATETSGARQQANRALEHGRPVFLISSLVANHGWARELVEQGKHGVKAIEIGTTEEILELVEATTSVDQFMPALD